MIKAMYLLKDIIGEKQENDVSFRQTPKKKIIADLNEIIDLSLEDYYSTNLS
ncbi:hypothetical protein PbJCM13498_36700 [Prolixibacter bellariivorans]|uniref:Uncharacterized protein n=2 Tax=Prolixibacter bellariivorans TaxID=314319 RepID=A0A5M4B530_9BACT|nr:hypothetical protein PbJCM13498_36700 [Prolixibacter bellariivorans]